MGKEKKTRFFARVDGIERVLFSVKQNSNGDLTITSCTGKMFEPTEQNYLEFEHQHYSIHESAGGLSTTITQKTQLVGSHYSICTFIPDTKNYLLWPVFARRYPILKPEESLLNRKPSETAIQVAQYSYDNRTLLYSVFVARPSFDFTILKNAGIDFRRATFKNHVIIVIPYFINCQSFITGDVVGFTSSSPVIDKVRSTDHVQYDIESIPYDGFLKCNSDLMASLRDHLIYRVKREMSELGFYFPLFEEYLEPTQKPIPS